MPARTPLLIRLMSRLGEVEVKEEYIPREKGCDIHGMWEPDGIIKINPVPHIVDTILHELVHELHPTYSEQAVRSIVGKLTKHMTEAETLAVYEAYKRKLEEI